ncbi:MAG: lipopolysaccharide biosynthesis protein [Arthrobacter sp.]|nr:lipopolysaccharide biosynthesis protein [Arthrobacter sp.]
MGSILIPLSSLLVAPLLTRSLGPVGQGNFSTSQSVIVVAASLLGLGASDSLAVYSNYWRRTFRWSVWGAAVLVALVVSLGGAMAFAQASLLPWDLILPLTGGAVIFALALIQRGEVLNRNMILETSVEKWITSLLRLALTAGFFVTGRLDLQAAVLSLVLPQFVGYIYLSFAVLRVPRQPGMVSTRIMRRVTDRPLRTATWAVLGGLGGVLLVNLDPIVLRPLIGAEQLGYYAIAMLIAELFTVAAKPFRDAALAGSSGVRKAGEFTSIIKWCALVMTAGLVICGCTLWFLIPFVFGHAFEGAVLPALILAFGGWAKGLGFLVNGILVRTGHARMRAYATLTAVAFSVGGMILLSPWGAVGAAVAGAFAYLVMLTPGVIFLRARQGNPRRGR